MREASLRRKSEEVCRKNVFQLLLDTYSAAFQLIFHAAIGSVPVGAHICVQSKPLSVAQLIFFRCETLCTSLTDCVSIDMHKALPRSLPFMVETFFASWTKGST